MTIDLTLKGQTESDLITALPFLRAIDEIDGSEIWCASEACMIDILGIVEGYDGFYMNLRCNPAIAEQIPQNMIVEPPASFRHWF